MALVSEQAKQRLKDALYLGPTERMDRCDRCKNSRPVGRELYCEHKRAMVGRGGICAVWVPMRKMVPA